MSTKSSLVLSALIIFIFAGFLIWHNSEENKTMLTYESRFPFAETLNYLKDELQKQEIPVFAEFDHAANAQNVGLPLRPTTVVVFGSPKVGTKLMEINQSIALELPLKIVIWEDEKGKTWLGFHNVNQMAEKYELENNPIIPKMQELMEKLVHSAGGQ